MSHTITGSEALIRALISEGVDRVFGYPGGAIMPVYDTLYDYSDRLTHILTRHEQGAIHAAQGYARVSHRTGVVIATSGPGAANLITGISDANSDSTPLVVIVGQVHSALLGTDAFQETDVVGITQPISKWTAQIRRPEDIPGAVARAFYIANTGRPGPVVLDIAKDAQTGTFTPGPYRRCSFIRSYEPYPEVLDRDLQTAAALLNGAMRPLILAGHGVMIAGAETELAALAEKADLPVACTLLGLSTMPSGHPLYKGMLGMHGNIGPNVNTNRADVILAVGMRFDDRVTAAMHLYAPQARIIHVDIDKSEFDKNIPVDLRIHGDAREVLHRLYPLVREAKHTAWLRSFDRMAADEAEAVIRPELEGTDPDALPHMGEVARKVSLAAGIDPVLVTDVGLNQMLSARYFRYTAPRSIVTSGGLGTMGFGLPAAIGARMGAPTRTVCCFMGDGGFQMTLQELGTVMQYGVNIKMIVLNNDFLGNVRQWQELFFDSRFSQTPMVNPDFTVIASAYGIPSRRVTRRADLDDAIDAMMKHDGAYLLEVAVSPTDKVFPMTPGTKPVDYVLIAPDTPYQAPDNDNDF